MASRQFDDGAAVIVRATGEAATVIRLLPQNGIDPTNYYEIRRAGSALGESAAEGLLIAAAPAAPAAPVATPTPPDAPVAPPEGQQTVLVAEAEQRAPAPTPSAPAPADVAEEG